MPIRTGAGQRAALLILLLAAALWGCAAERIQHAVSLHYEGTDAPRLFETSQPPTIVVSPFHDRRTNPDRLGVYQWQNLTVEMIPKGGPASAAVTGMAREFIFSLQMAFGDPGDVRQLGRRLFSSHVLTSEFRHPDGLVVLRELFGERGFPGAFRSDEHHAFGVMGTDAGREKFPVGVGIAPCLCAGNWKTFAIEIHLDVSGAEMPGELVSIGFGGEDDIGACGAEVADAARPDIPEIGMLMRLGRIFVGEMLDG